MGRRNRKRRAGKKGKLPRHGSTKAEDWSDFLKGGVLPLLEVLPWIERISTFIYGDTIEEHLNDISAAIHNQISPELLNHGNVLQAIHKLLQPAVENASNQTELLKEIRELLTNFRSPNVFGQFVAISLLTEAISDIKRLADQAEKMATSLKGIEENLLSVNLGGDYFPGRVYSWVRNAIEISASSNIPHYFTTFNLGNAWWPKFRDLDRENPLGPRYLGHKTDLDELCAFLADEVRPRVGPEAVLHVFMPTLRQMALKEAVKLPEAMHPCIFEGQRGDAGCPFVYICFTEDRDKESLHDIGVLRARQVWASTWAVGACVPILHQWLAYKSDPTFYIDPSCRVVWMGGMLIADTRYFPCGLEPPRTLGRPVEPGSRPWYT